MGCTFTNKAWFGQDAHQVGIGTDDPQHNFTILFVDTPGYTSNVEFGIDTYSGTQANLGTWSNHPLVFYINGSESCRVTSNTISTPLAAFDILNTSATSINAFGAATSIEIGAATGTTNINHDLDVDGDVNIDGGDLTTSSGTFNILNTTASTVNFAGAATVIEIGAATGITNINHDLDVDGDVNIDGGDLTTGASTFNLINTTAKAVNFAGAANTIYIGSASTSAIYMGGNSTTVTFGIVSLSQLDSSTSTFNLVNTTATTVNFGGAATTISIGAGTGTTTVKNNLTVNGTFNGNAINGSSLGVTGNVGCNTVNAATLNASVGVNAVVKAFVIKHPTKEGKKLVHGSLEGPEYGVYVRGRCTTNYIELPEYWTGLVDFDTITVDLTPIGKHQKLYVEKIEGLRVYINNEDVNGKVNCFYSVWGERKDVPKLVTEVDDS